MAGLAAMDHGGCRTILLLLLTTSQMLSTSAQPVFDADASYVTTLYELQKKQVELVDFTCTDSSGTDTNPVVSLPSGGVSPSSPCGDCFSVLPTCSSGAEYCLIFTPEDDISTVSEYYVTVLCVTDDGQQVTQLVDIRLTRNTSPYFDPDTSYVTKTLSSAESVTAGSNVFKLATESITVNDDNNDTLIYTMTSEPSSDNFELVSGDGTFSIKAKNDLMSECNDQVVFTVSVTDSVNDPVTMTVTVTLEDRHVAPDITSMDFSMQLGEDTAVSDNVHVMTWTPSTTSVKDLTFTLTASPATNAELFVIKEGKIKVLSELDFEDTDAYSTTTNLTVSVSDGYCSSSEHYLYITLTDVNEAPELSPATATYTVYEGSDLYFGEDSPLTIPWEITDEDAVDSHTYSIIAVTDGKEDYFSIDASTGELSLNADYDVDLDADGVSNMLTSQTITVQITDKGEETATATVVLTFKDRNDHEPVIEAGDFGYSVCETSRKIGATLGTLTCTDEDTSFEGNNSTYFSNTESSSQISVLPNGNIIMSSRPATGSTYTATACCSDYGTFPGPLTSSSCQAISLTGTECSTTTTDASATTTTTAAAATTTAAADTAQSRSWVDDNLWWIILAALLATALLALLTYMCLVFCRKYCAKCCRRKPRPPRQVQPPRRAQSPPRVKQPARLQTPPPRVKTPPGKVAPAPPKPPSPPPKPPTPDVVGDPNAQLWNFWQERFADDDYLNHPARADNPRPITPLHGATNGNGYGGGPGPKGAAPPKITPANAAAAAAKGAGAKKPGSCSIM